VQYRWLSRAALLFGIGTKAVPSWDPRRRWSNLKGGSSCRSRSHRRSCQRELESFWMAHKPESSEFSGQRCCRKRGFDELGKMGVEIASASASRYILG